MNVIITINCRKGAGIRWSIIRDLSLYGVVGANEVVQEDEDSLQLRVAFCWSDSAFVGQAAGVLSHIQGVIEITEEPAPEIIVPTAPPVPKSKFSISSIVLGGAICALAGFAYVSIPAFFRAGSEPIVHEEPPPPVAVSVPEAPKEQAPPEPVAASLPPVIEAKPEPRPTPPPPREQSKPVPVRVAPRAFVPPTTPQSPEAQVISAPPSLPAQAESLPATPVVKLPVVDQNFPAATPKRAEPQEPAIAAIAAPRPLKRVEPTVSSAMKSSLKGDIIVAVKVYVAANGQVLSTVPMKQADAKANQLAALAADSVKRWQFEPATQNGKPLPGETIVRFRF